jgi:CBS domain-containing protein
MLISDVLAMKGRRVATVLPTDTVEFAVGRLAELRIGAVVVEDKWQKLVGIFSERDLVRLISREGTQALNHRVEQVMTSPVITCHPSDRIDAVLSIMTQKTVRHLPVIDQGQLVGIISIGDLVKHRLEEKAHEAEVMLDIARMRA